MGTPTRNLVIWAGTLFSLSSGLAPSMFANSPKNVAATEALEQHLEGGSTIYRTPGAGLVDAVRQCVAAKPSDAASYVQAALSTERGDSDLLAPRIVHSAILGLGDKPSDKDIAAIVGAATKARPEAVLPIVRSAVRSSPRSSASAIVKAAVMNVPDPHAKVFYKAESATEAGGTIAREASDAKEIRDAKAVVDAKDYKGLPGNRSENPDTDLSDAIVRAALEAGQNLDPATLALAATDGIFARGGPPGGSDVPPLTPVSPPVPPLVPPLGPVSP